MVFPVGQFVAVTGTVGAAGAAAAAAYLNRSNAELESGELVRRVITPQNDIWAQYITDAGVVQRGWRWRIARSGARTGQRIIHPGVDISAPQGTPIHAMRSGIVEHSGLNSGYGEVILIRHRDGSSSWYAHLNDRLVRRGQLVAGGEIIATMGRTSSIGAKPVDLSRQGRPGDPRTTGFPGMNPHLHMSVHGVGPLTGADGGPLFASGRLPALAPRRSAVRRLGGADVIGMSTDNHRGARLNEYQWGVDPQAYIGSHGVRLIM